MSPRKAKDNITPAAGLRLSGTVEHREKRFVPKDSPKTEAVTYTVGDGSGRVYYLHDYSPTSYFEVGERIDVPVYVKPYQKNGTMSYTINVQKPRQSKGEAF